MQKYSEKECEILKWRRLISKHNVKYCKDVELFRNRIKMLQECRIIPKQNVKYFNDEELLRNIV